MTLLGWTWPDASLPTGYDGEVQNAVRAVVNRQCLTMPREIMRDQIVIAAALPAFLPTAPSGSARLTADARTWSHLGSELADQLRIVSGMAQFSIVLNTSTFEMPSQTTWLRRRAANLQQSHQVKAGVHRICCRLVGRTPVIREHRQSVFADVLIERNKAEDVLNETVRALRDENLLENETVVGPLPVYSFVTLTTVPECQIT